MSCPNIEQNKEFCNCTYAGCPREGKCCECIQYHWKMGQLPACLFPDDVEQSYDRSVENFIQTYEDRGPWW